MTDYLPWLCGHSHDSIIIGVSDQKTFYSGILFLALIYNSQRRCVFPLYIREGSTSGIHFVTLLLRKRWGSVWWVSYAARQNRKSSFFNKYVSQSLFEFFSKKGSFERSGISGNNFILNFSSSWESPDGKWHIEISFIEYAFLNYSAQKTLTVLCKRKPYYNRFTVF